MKSISVKFLGEEFSFPADLQEFVKILQYFDSLNEELNPLLLNLMENADYKSGDEKTMKYFKDPMTVLAKWVVAKLSEYNIYDVTISELVDNNDGYIKLKEVCDNTFEGMKKLTLDSMTEWYDGYIDAQSNAASKVTGMGFSVWTSSLTSALVYSAMEANTVKKQQTQAQKEYTKAIDKLQKNINERKSSKENSLLKDYYYPNVAAALSQFVGTMMIIYIDKLDKSGVLDFNSVKDFNLKRSSELLENIDIVNDKKSLLKQAFVICPYNSEIYIYAAESGLMDRETSKTAYYFMQYDVLVSTLKTDIGELTLPCNLSIEISNIYKYMKALSVCLDIPLTEMFKAYASPFYDDVTSKYSQLWEYAKDSAKCIKLLSEIDDDKLLFASANYVKELSEKAVTEVISTKDFRVLCDDCGYDNLLAILSKDGNIFADKTELDNHLISKIEENITLILPKKKERIYKKQLEEKNEKARLLAFSEQKKKEEEEHNRKSERNWWIITIIVLLFFIVLLLIPTVFSPLYNYNKAIKLYDNKKYEEAIILFAKLNTYKESEEYGKKSKYNLAKDKITKKEYNEAYSLLQELGSFNDSDVLLLQTKYDRAVDTLNLNRFDEAIELFTEIRDYNNSETMICRCKYKKALKLINDRDYRSAYLLLKQISHDEEDKEEIDKSKYDIAMTYLKNEEYDAAYAILRDISYYSDAAEQIEKSKYNRAMKLLDLEDYDAAYRLLKEIKDYSDSEEQINKSIYSRAKELQKNKEYEQALELYNQVLDYSDSSENADFCEKLIK